MEVVTMSRFYFDYKAKVTRRDREGYDCFNTHEASQHADYIAKEMAISEPETHGAGYISVINESGAEVHRSSV
jgi:hypothetical protein